MSSCAYFMVFLPNAVVLIVDSAGKSRHIFCITLCIWVNKAKRMRLFCLWSGKVVYL